MRIPDDLRETIKRVHGAAGQRWLAALPGLMDEWRKRWALRLDAPFENLSYNFVIPGRTADGQAVVLKAGVPCRELSTEAAALGLFHGEGAVRLLDHDASRGALLLERITPGTPLYEVEKDPQAVRTTARLMRQLWRTPPAKHSLPSLPIWFHAFGRLRGRFGGGTGPISSAIINRAERAFAQLAASSEKSVILHGDLHHGNILFSAERGWVAIDPKGITGERGYEVGPFMLNQLPLDASGSALMETFAQRLSIFAEELRIDRERLALWAFCHAVLSALWDLEEEAEWAATIKLAEMLEHFS
jgi:streptomycin 6-kinase